MVAPVTESEAADRVRNLLLRGDNLLKHGRSEDKAREAFEQARQVAAEAGLDERIRRLIERRLEQLG
jgi:predicted negative regulator of RcsB-dependent stress response